jgi:hypothetical protein
MVCNLQLQNNYKINTLDRRLTMNWEEAHLQGDLEAMQQAREEAIVRAAMERAADRYANGFPAWDTFGSAERAIRAIASDPAEVAAIIKAAGGGSWMSDYRIEAATKEEWAVRALIAEAKLAKAMKAMQFWSQAQEPDVDAAINLMQATIAELKGETND